jgi:hypothetical protein
MRRGLAWLAGAIGIAALARALRQRGRSSAGPVPATPDPADELRAALDEADVAEQPAAAASAPDADAHEEPPSLEERRRRVHEAAQEALDSMREPPPAS